MRFGAHESVAGGLERAFPLASEDGCDAVQIFSKNASQWREPELTEAQVAAFRAARRAWSPAGPVMVHASYLINLCADGPLLVRSREALTLELARASALGIDYVVFHPGAHMGVGERLAIELVAESLTRVLRDAGSSTTRLCLENTAGQGTTMGARLEQIGEILERTACVGERLGVCIDTQHAFAAGYDLVDERGYDAFWSDFDRYVGRDRLACMHLNDSKCPRGARLDRHAPIGDGDMGALPFWRLANDPRLADVPGVLELAPAFGKRILAENIARLRAFVGSAPPAAFRLTSPPPAKRARGRRT